MTTEQLEQLRELIERWRENDVSTGDPDYYLERQSIYTACADALEEVVQSFNQDEES